MTEDRREEFKYEYWQWGRVLITRETRGWSEEEIKRAGLIEGSMAFINFTSLDQGKGRIFIYKFKDYYECWKAVTVHNQELKMYHVQCLKQLKEEHEKVWRKNYEEHKQ